MGEFELISHYFKRAACAQAGGALTLGIGDDCALLNLAVGEQLAVSSDSLVEGVHFPKDCDPALLAMRGLACAVSDLAAMGAEPMAFTLALTLPKADERWLAAFAQGLEAMAAQCNIALAGGDTTRGPLNLNFTVFGHVPFTQALRRSGAAVGDVVCVGGSLGDGAGALAFVLGEREANANSAYLLERYWQPAPQLALGKVLRGLAHAAMDISDGLVADAAHIASASGVQLVLERAKLPLSKALVSEYGQAAAQAFALTGGDDYRLLFTLPRESYLSLIAQGFAVTAIGTVAPGAGVVVLDEHAEPLNMAAAGFTHF